MYPITFPLWVLVEILRGCGGDLINSITFIDLFSLGGFFSHIRRNSLFYTQWKWHGLTNLWELWRGSLIAGKEGKGSGIPVGKKGMTGCAVCWIASYCWMMNYNIYQPFFLCYCFPDYLRARESPDRDARATNGGYPSKEDNLLWLTWPKCWSPHEKNIQYPGEGITQPLLKIHSVSLFLNGHLQENAAKKLFIEWFDKISWNWM